MRHLLLTTMALTLLLISAPATRAAEESPAAGAFSPAGSLTETGGINTATLLPDGRVFVLGGGSNFPSAAEVWDPATDRFSPAAWLTWGRSYATTTSLPDGRVLVVGGQPDVIGSAYPRSWDVLRVAETWDPATFRFHPAGTLTQSRATHDAILLLDGRVLIIGGDFDEYGISAEIWDPVTETFGQVAWLTVPRFKPTETLLADGRVLVVGGGATNELGPDPDAAEIWDPATGAFSRAGSLIETRINHTATLLSDGRVLVIGGWGGSDFLASAEVWDPTTETFSPTGSLDEARSLHTATLMPDGRVLVIGGWRGEGELTSAEIWDPATGEFSSAGSLGEGRENHTATLTADGRVLVIGGEGENGPLASAEVWTPTD